MNKPRNKSYSIMFDIIKGNKIMQRSNEQVTPKRDLLPPWLPPPGRAVLSIAAAFPLCTAIEILCRRYSQLWGSQLTGGGVGPGPI